MSDDARKQAEREADALEDQLHPDAPPTDFNTLVISLGSTALVHLGAAPPELLGGMEPPPKNLEMAKQTIDLLAMLEDKTQGNLTGEEERLLSQLLYDLRMKYIAEAQ